MGRGRLRPFVFHQRGVSRGRDRPRPCSLTLLNGPSVVRERWLDKWRSCGAPERCWHCRRLYVKSRLTMHTTSFRISGLVLFIAGSCVAATPEPYSATHKPVL